MDDQITVRVSNADEFTAEVVLAHADLGHKLIDSFYHRNRLKAFLASWFQTAVNMFELIHFQLKLNYYILISFFIKDEDGSE